ncbi:MAG: hypothetical protein LIO85_07690 [Rikenellaceae bacterium]|nr:hypothetical protein [Rikenellaceae bacterium]
MKVKGIFTKLAVAAVTVLITSACGGGAGNDPVKIAEKYAHAYSAWKLEECTELMGPFYEDSELEYERKLLDKETSRTVAKILSKHKVTIKYNEAESRIGEDYARIVLDIQRNKESGEGWVELMKSDGIWYVKYDRIWIDDETLSKIRDLVIEE